MTGLIHLYCGGGKGKTTAAVGLTVRCAGRGNKVVFAQFLKDGTSGECRVLAKLPGVTVMAAITVGKFSFRMTDAEKRETADALTRTLDVYKRQVISPSVPAPNTTRLSPGMIPPSWITALYALLAGSSTVASSKERLSGIWNIQFG